MSQHLLEHEAKYVGREVDDYCLLSINDLRQKLADRRDAWRRAKEQLETQLRQFGERERAAIQCLIVRDCHHLFELYLAYVQSRIGSGDIPGPSTTRIAREEDAPHLPFSEWLFA